MQIPTSPTVANLSLRRDTQHNWDVTKHNDRVNTKLVYLKPFQASLLDNRLFAAHCNQQISFGQESYLYFAENILVLCEKDLVLEQNPLHFSWFLY